MHTYNPFTLPDIISEITPKLSLEDLDKFCWINKTWYKEIQYELRKRWEIQVLKGHKLELEKDEKIKKTLESHSDDEEDQGYLEYDIELKYLAKLLETAKKQVEIERYMFANGMFHGQEKEIAKNNIQQIANEKIPWGYTYDGGYENNLGYVDDWNMMELLEQRLLIPGYEINNRDYWKNFVFRIKNNLTTHKQIGNDPKYRDFKVQLALHKENRASLIIQQAYRLRRKQINSAKIIQNAVIKWLYRPGGSFMKHAQDR
ncbi:7875_t:CDS:2, partial [Dentiscutata erythropus]